MLMSFVLEGGLHTATAWTSSPSACSTTSRSASRPSPAPARRRRASSTSRWPRRPATRPRTPTSPCALEHLLKPRLAARELLTVYETLERPLPTVLVEMELAGIKVDRQTCAASPRLRACAWASWRPKPTSWPAGRSTWARPSRSATSCSARWACPAASKTATGAWSHRRLDAGGPGRPGPRTAAHPAGLAPALQAEGHLHRQPGRRDRPADRPGAHLLRAGGGHHRAAGLVRPQPAEHPDPHRGRPQDPQAPSSPSRATC